MTNLVLRRTAATVFSTSLLAPPLAATSDTADAVSAKHYKNCTALNKDYKHGVGKKGAKDKTSGTPVKNFKVSDKVYNMNNGPRKF